MSNLKEQMKKDAENSNNATTAIEEKILNNIRRKIARFQKGIIVGKTKVTYGTDIEKAMVEYTKGTKLIQHIKDIGKYGLGNPGEDWNDANIFADDNGYKASVLYGDMTGDPYKIRIKDPEGNFYLITDQSLRGQYGLKGGSLEASDILKALDAQFKNGASISEIAQNFSECKIKDYPPEIKQEVDEQKTVNDKIRKQYEKTIKLGDYVHYFETNNGINGFDPYKQSFYPDSPYIYLSQNNRQTSGNKYEEIKEGYSTSINYAPKSTNVSQIHLSYIDYTDSDNMYPSYDEKLDIKTLTDMGYDKEHAQAKLNKIAQQVLSGKPLKEIFIENRIFMTEKSAEKLTEKIQNHQKSSYLTGSVKRIGAERN